MSKRVAYYTGRPQGKVISELRRMIAELGPEFKIEVIGAETLELKKEIERLNFLLNPPTVIIDEISDYDPTSKSPHKP